MVLADQQTLRKQLRASRRQLSSVQRKQFNHLIAQHIFLSATFLRAKNIACYLPIVRDGEVDLSAVIRAIWATKKSCYLPVLKRIGSGERLWFARYDRHTPLEINRFGILEPVASGRMLLKGGQLDLVLAPLVGFDEQGNRIGMGGGFYDRSFSNLRYRQHWRKPRLLGVAYECQKAPTIVPNPWDVALDAVVTEAAIYFGKQR